MKKNRILGVGIAILAVALVTMITGCPNGNEPSNKGNSTEKTLTAFKIAGKDPDGAIPDPITQAEWDDVDGIVTFTNQGSFTLSKDSLANASLSPTVTGGSVTYWIGYDYDRANASFTSARNLTFTDGDILFVKVTAGDKTVNYYKFNVTTLTSSASLSLLTVAGVSASTGTGAATWDTITVMGKVELTGAQKTDAKIVATVNQGATFKFAKVTGDGEPIFDTTDTITFADGDFLYIEVISADESTVMIYKVALEIGHNAKLESVAIGATPQSEALYLGTPAATWAGVTGTAIGNFQTNRQLTAGLGITILGQDSAAVIEYALVQEATSSAAEPTWTNYTSAIAAQVFDPDLQYYLYIKVTADAGDVLIYKLKIIIPAVGVVVYGNPEISFDTDKMAFWDNPNIKSFNVNRVNEAETIESYMRETWGLHTSAVVKAVWNDEGIYAYANVTTTQYKDTETGSLKDRPIANATETTNGAHLGDSFELFVNERLQVLRPGVQNDTGNQFRVGANNARSGRAAGSSVDPATTTGPDAVANFIANGQSATRLKNGDGKATAGQNGGYEVLVFVPFTEVNNANANQVFETGTFGRRVRDGSEIGLEFQFNTGVTNGARDGILTWNGVATASYAHSENYGLVSMDLAGATRVVNAERPTITVQPQAGIYEVGDTPSALTVVANVIQSNSVLSYQWYKGTSTTAANPTTVGTDSASYTPDISDGKTYYYWVVVTNTNTTVNGEQTRSVTSTTVAVVVTSDVAEQWVARISTVSGITQPVFGFNIPTDKKLGDYTKVTFDIKLESALAGRWRIYGPYTVTASLPTNSKLTLDNKVTVGGQGQLISGTGLTTGAPVVDAWTTVSISLTLSAATAAVTDLTGVVSLSFGGIDSGTPNYRIRNVKLSDDDATATVNALKPNSPLLWGGSAGGYDGVGTAVYAGESGASLNFHFYDDEDDIIIQQGPPPPDAPFVVDLTSQTTKNATAVAANTDLFTITLNDGTDDIDPVNTTYTTMTVVFKTFDDVGTELLVAPPFSNFQGTFYNNTTAVGGAIYNLGASSVVANPDTAQGGFVWTRAVPVGNAAFNKFLFRRSSCDNNDAIAEGKTFASFLEVLAITVE